MSEAESLEKFDGGTAIDQPHEQIEQLEAGE